MLRSMIRIMFLAILLVVNINSQTITNYGVKVGAVASNPIWRYDKETKDDVETLLGVDFGFFINWHLSKKLSLSTEAHYIQKGSRFYLAIDNPTNPYPGNGYDALLVKISPIVNYISFPIEIKYDLLNSEVIPYIIAGFRVDFMVSKNKDFESYFERTNISKIDFGGSIGIGFQTKSLIGIGTGIELKYSPSFMKVISTDFWANVTNRSFEISFIIYN